MAVWAPSRPWLTVALTSLQREWRQVVGSCSVEAAGHCQRRPGGASPRPAPISLLSTQTVSPGFLPAGAPPSRGHTLLPKSDREHSGSIGDPAGLATANGGLSFLRHAPGPAVWAPPEHHSGCRPWPCLRPSASEPGFSRNATPLEDASSQSTPLRTDRQTDG